MREFTCQEVVAHRFEASRQGYKTIAVDHYLEQLGEYIAWLREQLAQRQASERAALCVLQNAQRVADETMARAQADSQEIRTEAEKVLGQARAKRAEARSIGEAEGDVIREEAVRLFEMAALEVDRELGEARQEADRILEDAKIQARECLDEAYIRADAVDAATGAKSEELRSMIVDVDEFVDATTTDMRAGAWRLATMADYLQNELVERTASIDVRNMPTVLS